MPENVHHQFARVGVGDAQFIAAIFEEATLLLRMPVFIRHPARAFGGEAQHGENTSGRTCCAIGGEAIDGSRYRK